MREQRSCLKNFVKKKDQKKNQRNTQKDVAAKSVLNYPLGMETTTPTAAPKFKNQALTLEPIKTETKTTQADTFIEYTLKQDITIEFPYNKKEYKTGDKLPVRKADQGFCILDGYDCHVIEGYTLNGQEEKTHYLPTELLERKEYAIVREYKTTLWEVIEK
jgi:hypothetical protein